ncbi:MAG: FAD:protein FMN transferase [Acidobacteriota bacterium]
MNELPAARVHRSAREAMGTVFEVFIAGGDASYAGQAAQAVFAEVSRLERLFSRFNACSEIGQINRLKAGETLRIGLEAYECLKTAERVRDETRGAFDINFRKAGALLGRSGFEVFSNASGFFIRVRSGILGQEPVGVDLDLGAIGKGFALDRAASILSDWDIENFLIHGGTSTTVAAGSAPGLNPGESGWPVGVGGKWDLPGIPKRILLRGRALSGSGTEVKGRHIQDPKTGGPSGQNLAAWAAHPSAAEADALSTAFMVMIVREVKDYCRRHPEVWALIIKKDGEPALFNW